MPGGSSTTCGSLPMPCRSRVSRLYDETLERVLDPRIGNETHPGVYTEVIAYAASIDAVLAEHAT